MLGNEYIRYRGDWLLAFELSDFQMLVSKDNRHELGQWLGESDIKTGDEEVWKIKQTRFPHKVAIVSGPQGTSFHFKWNPYRDGKYSEAFSNKSWFYFLNKVLMNVKHNHNNKGGENR
jgi:hypothetical protein